jgi:EipB-like
MQDAVSVAGEVACGARHPYLARDTGDAERRWMLNKAAVCALATAALATLVGGAVSGRGAAALPAGGEFASHRAVYELRLAQARGNSSTMSARGRILYDFSGNACEGYALQFRQVSELDNGEGKVSLSDLRSTTWEDGDAKKFIFKSQNYLNQSLIDTVDGVAERGPGDVNVTLTKPGAKTFELATGIAFPTDHMRRVIAAARAGKSFLEVPVFDGSEKGERVYQTLSVIGPAIAPNEKLPVDAAAGKKALEGLVRWPVTVSYFDRTAAKPGDQLPVYSIKFELYENGVSRALLLDYNDFAITGELTALELRDSKPCN